MNKSYGKRWKKLLAEIDIFNESAPRVNACLFKGSLIEIYTSASAESEVYAHKIFPTTPKGLREAYKWVVEMKRQIAEQAKAQSKQ